MKLKQLLAITLIIGLTVSMFAFNCFAARQGIINGSDGSLNVRKGPGTQYEKIDELKNGTVVDILSTSGSWFCIEYKNGSGKTVSGYVAVKYVKLIEDPEQPIVTNEIPAAYRSYLSKLQSQHPNWEFRFYNTGLDWNTVVANESKSGVNAIAGAPLSYRSTSCRFSIGNEKYYDGYVSATYLKRDGATYTVNTSGSNLTLRSGAGTEYGSVASIPNGTVVFVNSVAYDSQGSAWFKVRYYSSYGDYTYKNVEGVTWFQPHGQVIRYYLDPRNFFDEKTVFQFEELTFEKDIHTQKGVEAILKGSFMDGVKIDTTDGRKITYAQAIMEAAAAYNVSPYHLASRIIQEVGKNGSVASRGDSVLYPGIYNLYNIGAYTGVYDGLKWASKSGSYQRPWNTPYKSLVGGAEYIANGYISVGQSTLYFQKFDVVQNGTANYDHQYMSNIVAPSSEGSSVFKAYKEMGITDSKLVFLIPVYDNMPSFAYPLPASYSHPNMLPDSSDGVISKYADVNAGDWYYDAIIFAEENGYLTAADSNYFGVYEKVRREDFAVVISKLAGANLPAYKDVISSFADVTDTAEYKNPIMWSADRNIIRGYDSGLFGVGDNITREQLCTVIYRYAQFMCADMNLSDSVDNILNKFNDVSKISGFAKESVAWCVDNGIISGNGNGNMSPQNNTGRAELAIIIKRLVDNGFAYKGYPDVLTGTWYYDAVQTVTNRKLLKGYSDGKFGPADSVQRQDFIVILSRITGIEPAGENTVNITFPDVVSPSYYSDAIEWAVANEIISGYQNGSFGVGDNLTRQDACTVLYRFARFIGLDTELSDDEIQELFEGYDDAGKIYDYAATAMAWCIKNGVISGKNSTTLAPTEFISRAQIAAVFTNMIKHELI